MCTIIPDSHPPLQDTGDFARSARTPAAASAITGRRCPAAPCAFRGTGLDAGTTSPGSWASARAVGGLDVGADLGAVAASPDTSRR